MHNTASTWKLSLEGMCTGESEIFYKFKLMKHSCWFTNVSQGNYSTQRQELNNLAMYMCIFKSALWLGSSDLSAPSPCSAGTQSSLPSIYKLLLTQMVVKSEPEIFNPFLRASFFPDRLCQSTFPLPAASVTSVCCRVGWEGRIWPNNFSRKSCSSYFKSVRWFEASGHTQNYILLSELKDSHPGRTT